MRQLSTPYVGSDGFLKPMAYKWFTTSRSAWGLHKKWRCSMLDDKLNRSIVCLWFDVMWRYKNTFPSFFSVHQNIYIYIPGLATVLSVIESQCWPCKKLARLFQFCKVRFFPNVALELEETLECKISINSAFSVSLQKSRRFATFVASNKVNPHGKSLILDCKSSSHLLRSVSDIGQAIMYCFNALTWRITASMASTRLSVARNYRYGSQTFHM